MFYTKHQVQARLGVSTTTLYRMIHDGRLRAYLPEGATRGYRFFPEDIDTLAECQGQVLPTLEVTCANDHDLAQVVALSLEVAGPDHTLRWSVGRTMREHHPTAFLVASDRSTHRILGATCLLPLRWLCMQDLLSGTRQLAQVQAQDLATDPIHHLLLPTFVVDPQANQVLMQAALARGILQHLSERCRHAPPLHGIFAPKQPILPPVIHRLLGLVPRPDGGYLGSPGEPSGVTSLFQALSQQTNTPSLALPPTYWADALAEMAQDDDALGEAILLSLAPPRQRGRPRACVPSVARLRQDMRGRIESTNEPAAERAAPCLTPSYKGDDDDQNTPHSH